MSNIKKIQYFRNLKMQKSELERNLAFINRTINEQSDYCSHIGVNLGKFLLYNRCRCLICGRRKEEITFLNPEHIINAENYLPQYDMQDDKQCDEKLDTIQTLALGLLKENPDMSSEQLVYKLNDLIQESISFRESKNEPKLVLKQQNKKSFEGNMDEVK